MKRHIGIIVLALLVFVVLLIITVTYVVDETKDIVLITTFGKITQVVDGREDPGLHFKLPWPIIVSRVQLSLARSALATNTRMGPGSVHSR